MGINIKRRMVRIGLLGAAFMLTAAFAVPLFPAHAASGTWGLIGTSLGEQDFSAVASSASGRYLAAAVTHGSIYTSSDYGASWIERTGPGSRNWTAVVISEDGSKLAASVNNGKVYTSTNYGETWVQRASLASREWGWLAASADGSKLLVAAEAGGSLGGVALSKDSGATWTTLDTGNFRAVGVSDDGQYLAYYGEGDVFLSADGGDTWDVALEPQGDVTGIDLSANGSRIVVLDASNIKVANTSDLAWSSYEDLNLFAMFDVDMDAGGQNIAVAMSGDHGIITSEDSGQTWQPGDMTDNLDLRSIASDSSGQRLIAAGMQRLWVNVGPIELADYNNDGIPDVDQPNLSSYVNPLTGKRVVIDVGNGCEIIKDDYTAESGLAVQDPAYQYANGLFDFAGDCGTLGFTTTVKLYYYNVSKANLVVRKYSPVTHAYFNLTGAYDATLKEITIGGQTVTVASYQITDGGDLDMDTTVNGEFEDPAGLAQNIVSTPNTGLKAVQP